ncbi:hypothetical protein ACFFX0_32340 [Citricoccus parietis]|uniref:Uncharacterized protein n=1 Tax=Citricoccus parietis TaxID=592307 RepID=A0ABV5G9I9_9MICC
MWCRRPSRGCGGCWSWADRTPHRQGNGGDSRCRCLSHRRRSGRTGCRVLFAPFVPGCRPWARRASSQFRDP